MLTSVHFLKKLLHTNEGKMNEYGGRQWRPHNG